MSNSRLASLLVQDGLVPARRMTDAFSRQVIYGGTLDTVLLEMGLVQEAALLEAIGRATGLPTRNEATSLAALGPGTPMDWFAKSLAEQFRVAPFERADGVVRVLVLESFDRSKLDELGFSLGLMLEPVATLEARLLETWHTVYGAPVPARYATLLSRLSRSRPQQTPPPAQNPPPGRSLITDVPFPKTEQTLKESATPRLTTREAAAPQVAVAPERTIAVPAAEIAAEPRTASVSISLDEARARIERTDERDEIFRAMCQGARAIAPIAIVLTVAQKRAVAKVALAKDWFEEDRLAALSIPLDRPSPAMTVVETRAPYVGRIGDDAATGPVLDALGRKSAAAAMIVPILIKERVVAMLMLLGGDQGLEPERLGELAPMMAAATRVFSTILAKKTETKKPSEKSEPSAPKETMDRARTPASRGLSAVLSTTSVEARPAQPAQSAPPDLDQLVSNLLRDDALAATAADHLLAMKEAGARAVIARLPGPLVYSRAISRSHMPPLSEHGPLLAMLLRFGRIAIPALIERIEDPSLDIRYYVTLALGSLRHPSAVEALSERLFDPDEEVRRAAVSALVAFPRGSEIQTCLEILRAELPGPDPMRQRFATDALGALRDTVSIPRIVELVKHPEPAISLTAQRALVDLTKQDFGASRWRWRSWWEKHRTTPRLEWLIEGMAHDQLEIRQSAAAELVRLTGEDFEYDAALPKREREEARKRWLAWWHSHGSKEYK